MSWLLESQRLENTHYWGRQHYLSHPEHAGNMEVYQSPDFPHVFLGGEYDLEEAELKAGRPICKRIDCRKLPELTSDHPSWDYGEYSVAKLKFDKKVAETVNAIRSLSCPIFIHCALGANRSVSVLATALSKLTGKSVDSLFAEMKESREVVSPQDPYYLMALESTSGKSEVDQRFMELDQDFPLIQPEMPSLQDLSGWRSRLLEKTPERVFASSWFVRISNQDLVNEFQKKWLSINYQRNQLTQQIALNKPKTYQEQLIQDAEILNQLLPMRRELLTWMESQTGLISDPGLLKRWSDQIEMLRSSIQEDLEKVQEFQGSFDITSHNIDEVIEWATGSDVDILPVLDQFGIEHDIVQFPKKSVIRFETPSGMYVYENGSVTEANEWVSNADPFEYYEVQDDFWQDNLAGFKVYHATKPENVESILREGLAQTSLTRGLQNRYTPAAVFVSDNPEDISVYGDVIIEIDMGAMQADGYTPPVEKEEGIDEQELKGGLAHGLGLDDYVWEVDSDMSPTTLVIHGAIPAKYLRLL